MLLNNISFSIAKGEFVFLIGPSGVGKTTILRLLLREIFPSKGKIMVDGENIVKIKDKKIPFLRRKIGAAFQDFKLLLDRTVFENVALALEILGEKPLTIVGKVKKTLALVGLKGKENFFPIQLSGGEFQRVVIARAIVANPKILFADEPTGNLDQETSWQIVSLLKQINKKGTTVIMATHNVEIVKTAKERVISLKNGEIREVKKKNKEK